MKVRITTTTSRSLPVRSIVNGSDLSTDLMKILCWQDTESVLVTFKNGTRHMYELWKEEGDGIPTQDSGDSKSGHVPCGRKNPHAPHMWSNTASPGHVPELPCPGIPDTSVAPCGHLFNGFGGRMACTREKGHDGGCWSAGFGGT